MIQNSLIQTANVVINSNTKNSLTKEFSSTLFTNNNIANNLKHSIDGSNAIFTNNNTMNDSIKGTFNETFTALFGLAGTNETLKELAGSRDALFNNFDSEYLPEDLSISTMTITCHLGTLINIENIGKYLDLSLGNILCIKYDNDKVRSLIKVKTNEKSKKKKHKSFYNQATLIIDVKKKKGVNVKVFKNGAIQMTGCKSFKNCVDAVTILCNELQKNKAIYDKQERKIIRKYFVNNPDNISSLGNDFKITCVTLDDVDVFKIRMINSNFRVGFLINRETLYSLLTKMEIRCTFEPCIHACVNIKFNYKNKDTISIFVFESGSIIITGAKTKDHIVEAHKFITKILYENYYNIVKHNIDQFLERSDIMDLIRTELINSSLPISIEI